MQSIGRYQILRELGRGAMGVVYLAEDPAIGRSVAIKTINLDNLSEPGQEQMLRDRLMREARSAGILSHPGIVTVYDIQHSGSLACIVMEFVEGVTLYDRMISGDLSPEEALSILEQSACAIDYAHSKGVLHRDIKPANLMFTTTGQVKVADFGVARLNSQKTATTGMVLGTPSYMAPEQISNKALGPPTDQFSLAVLAYELLTGAKPFEGDSISGLLYSIVFESHVQVRSLNPTLPEAVELVFAKALAKDPLNRYPNCAAFAKALKAACETRKTWKPVRTVRGSQLSVPSDLAGVGGTMPAWGSESQTPPPTGTEPTLANTPFPPIASAVPMPSAPPQVAEVPRPVVEPSRHESVFQPVELAEKPPQNVKADEAPKPAPEKTKPPQTRQPAVEDGPSPQPAPLSSPKAKPADKKKILIAFAASFVVIVGGYLFWQSRKPVETAPAVAAEIPGSTAPVSAPPVASPPQTNKSPTPPPPVAVAGGAPAAPAAPAPFPVEVRTQPAGATVSVKEQKCVTPCQLDLNAGEHYVKAELDGYKDAFQMIQVPKMLELSVQLQKPMGTIEVRGPAGATIYVNGKPWATKAPARFQLEQGKYTLVLEHAEGGKSPEQVVDLTEGKIITLN